MPSVRPIDEMDESRIRFKDEAMSHAIKNKGLWLILILAMVVAGCETPPKPKPYGDESQLFLPGDRRVVWAVAPTINISGVNDVDPLLQSDLVYQQMQQVHGITVVPVNRVAQVYAALRIQKVQTEQDARAVCDALGCDALVVPTVTIFDPYDPPKLGASLQLFVRRGAGPVQRLDVHALDSSPTAPVAPPMTQAQHLLQSVGMYDASDGSVREKAKEYAQGRSDPNGPLGPDEVFLSMDCYCGFVYHDLIAQLLGEMAISASPGAGQAQSEAMTSENRS